MSAGWRAFLLRLLPLGMLVALALVLAGRSSTPARLALEQSFCAIDGRHWLGCGEGGIDVASFVGHACLRALFLALVVTFVSALVGTALGSAAALVRGSFELIMVRSCDLVQAFPTFLLALSVLAATPEPTRLHLGLVFLLTAWAPFARVAHATALSLRESDFVAGARAFGASRARVLATHVVPHIVGPVAVQLGTSAAAIVLGESALGFVGLGPSDGISLGALLDQGTLGMLHGPRLLLVAAVAVGATSGSLQLASEGLRRLLCAPRARFD